VKAKSGDRIVFRTAGGGGWGDPLERDPRRVRNDVARKLMTPAAAREQYGVVLSGDDFELDQRATADLREGFRAARGALPVFDFGERPGSGNGAAGQTIDAS
jgi:N-methylhydantoinase B